MSQTKFHGPKDVRAIEVQLYSEMAIVWKYRTNKKDNKNIRLGLTVGKEWNFDTQTA